MALLDLQVYNYSLAPSSVTALSGSGWCCLTLTPPAAGAVVQESGHYLAVHADGSA